MQAGTGSDTNDKRRMFDAIIIMPLEEEFEVVLEQFEIVENFTDDRHIRFVVSVDGCKDTYLMVKQAKMGRAGCVEATQSSLIEFDTSILMCVGIAGGLSSDVRIGDICYTGTLTDVLDNAKITDLPNGLQKIALLPTSYTSPRDLTIPITLDRINPATKPAHLAWAKERYETACTLIPNEFTDRDGKKKKIVVPEIHEGTIVCGLVSGSPEYNEKLKGIDRKVLAIETESGGLFNVVEIHRLPAITIRGISDYAGAGIDKNKFEEETNNNARKVAALNAATFLKHQLMAEGLRRYFEQRRTNRENSVIQPSFLPPLPADQLAETLIRKEDEFHHKLRDLSPSFGLVPKGYRLPMPRIRILDRPGDDKTTLSKILDVRDALRVMNIATIHIPREYPDSSIAWIIARNLISVQVDDKQLVPCVIEAKNIQRPHIGIDRLAGPDILTVEKLEQAQIVFIVDEFDFNSRSRSNFLLEQIKQRSKAKFLIITRNNPNLLISSEFAVGIASFTAQLNEISFTEMSHFVQKNFELDMPASEVIAIRLRETFHRYNLSAHPSYFAGIPRNILNGLLQANRRAELIELAVAGYLSFVVADDREPVTLSRTTREKFLTELAFRIRAQCETFTETKLTAFAAEFAKKFDFRIAPARFIAAFIDKGILHTENENIVFTLPFMQHYLLAKRFMDEPDEAIVYFNLDSEGFDSPTFTLYAEMGAAPNLVKKISEKLDEAIAALVERRPAGSVLLDRELSPGLLDRPDRLNAIRKRLKQAEEDVRLDRDRTREKQRFLDLNDRVREETAARIAEASTAREDPHFSVESDAINKWSIAVILLGSGAERLEANVKRELIIKVVNLAELIIDGWTRSHRTVDFNQIKNELKDELKKRDGAESDVLKAGADDITNIIVDLFEYIFLSQPLVSVMTFLGEEARYNVLVESIINTKI